MARSRTTEQKWYLQTYSVTIDFLLNYVDKYIFYILSVVSGFTMMCMYFLLFCP